MKILIFCERLVVGMYCSPVDRLLCCTLSRSNWESRSSACYMACCAFHLQIITAASWYFLLRFSIAPWPSPTTRHRRPVASSPPLLRLCLTPPREGQTSARRSACSGFAGLPEAHAAPLDSHSDLRNLVFRPSHRDRC